MLAVSTQAMPQAAAPATQSGLDALLNKHANRIVRFVANLAPLGRLRTIQNAPSPLPRTPSPVVLSPGCVEIEEVIEAPVSSNGSVAASGAAQPIVPDDDRYDQPTRMAIKELELLLSAAEDPQMRERYQCQIEKLQTVLVEPLGVAAPVLSEPEEPEEPVHPAPQPGAVADGVLDKVKRKVAQELARVRNVLPVPASPSEGNELRLPPATIDSARAVAPHHGIPTFSHLSHTDGIAPVETGLVSGLCTWFRESIRTVETNLRRSAEQQEKINNTPQPDPYTKLEEVCSAGTSKRLFHRLTRPSSAEVIRKLVSKGGHQGNPNAGTYGAPHLAVLSGEKKRLAALLDVAKGKIKVDRVSPEYKATALDLAVRDGRTDCVHLLLEQRAMASTKTFQMAAMKGDVETFKVLYGHCRSQANESRVHGSSVARIDFGPSFAEAVHGNHVEIARFLLARDVRLHTFGYEMLQMAARQGHAQMLELLLPHLPQAYEPLCNGKAADDQPLALAMMAGQEKAVAVLLRQHTDREYVKDVKESYDVKVAQLCQSDQARLAPVQARFERWLAHAGTASPVQGAAAFPVSATSSNDAEDATVGALALRKGRTTPFAFDRRK